MTQTRETYIIGDIHGCFHTLLDLLDSIGYDSAAPDRPEIWLVGDLVNNGPRSAEVLRWAIQHDPDIHCVLGNHDLHMLAVACGAHDIRDKDTFHDVLEAPDRADLIEWLATRALLHRDRGALMIHAGLLPDWDIATATRCAREVEDALREGAAREAFFEKMYGNDPRRWRADLDANDRMRLTVNALTRMRTIERADSALDFDYKGTLEDLPDDLTPWFRAEAPWRRQVGQNPDAPSRIFFGHWSAIGYHTEHHVHAMDSGATWGAHLERLPTQ